jgi:hypothetical protein
MQSIFSLPERIVGGAGCLLCDGLFKNLLTVDFFFEATTRDESIYDNCILLADAVSPRT